MKSDWKLIRELLGAVVDACELIDSLQITEEEWSATLKLGSHEVNAWDFLQSSWRYPENLRNCIVRARHGLSEDKKFIDETQRTLMAMGMLASELVGLEKVSNSVAGVDPLAPGDAKSPKELIDGLIDFYRNHLIANLPKVIESRRRKTLS